MNKIGKKEYLKLANEIGQLFLDWMKVLGMANYDVFLKTKYSDDWKEKIKNSNVDENTALSVNVMFPYKVVTLYVHEMAIKDYKRKYTEKIRRMLLHELFHVFIFKYRNCAEARYVQPEELLNEEEEMADNFSHIINNLIKK